MTELLDGVHFTGSSLSRPVFEWIFRTIPRNSKVLELGSGPVSTPVLGSVYQLTSIEQDPNYINSNYNTHHVPVINGWYDAELLKKHLPDEYDLLIIDGPCGSENRSGILKNLHLFNWSTTVLVHDTHRPLDKHICVQIARFLHRTPQFLQGTQDSFGVIL